MIFTSNLIVTGTITNIPVYANTLNAPSMSNVSFQSGINVKGSVFSTERIDCGATVYGNFKLNSNQNFQANGPEIYTRSNWFAYDYTSADMSAMSNMVTDMSAVYTIINYSTGVIKIPMSGLYNLQIQGRFQNDSSAQNVKNGVYFYFRNYAHCNARISAVMTPNDIVSSSYLGYMLKGDYIQPTFYSNDSNAVLVGNGETYVGFTVLSTVTPTHSNYIRIPYSSN